MAQQLLQLTKHRIKTLQEEIKLKENSLKEEIKFIKSLSPLQIGDKVVRNRKDETDKIEYLIYSITFDTDENDFTYGIAESLDAKIAKYSCISEEKLKKI